MPRRVELDLPGQLEQEIVGYPVSANSPFLRRGLRPSWARPTLIVRNEKILSYSEAEPVRAGDHVYLLAPPEKAQALDRFFVDMPPPRTPDPRLLGDFFVGADATLGALAEIYGLEISPADRETPLGDYLASRLKREPKAGDRLALGPITLVVHRMAGDHVASVGLRLAEDDADEAPATVLGRVRNLLRRTVTRLG
jgi:cell volume regulation protein A